MSSLPYHSCIEKGHLEDLKDRSKEMEAKRGGFRSAMKAETRCRELKKHFC